MAVKVSNKLKIIRMAGHLENIKEFSKRLGIDERQYSRYESGAVVPSLESALKIAITLDKSVEEIWMLEDVDTSP